MVTREDDGPACRGDDGNEPSRNFQLEISLVVFQDLLLYCQLMLTQMKVKYT